MVNERIVTGYCHRVLKDVVNALWERISYWTKASDVEIDVDQSTSTDLQTFYNDINEDIVEIRSDVSDLEDTVNGVNGKTIQVPINPTDAQISDYGNGSVWLVTA